MKYYLLIVCLLTSYMMSGYARANDDHATKKKSEADSHHKEHGTHANEKKAENEDEHTHTDDESEEHGHGDEHAHGEEEEENPQVGPNKGILAASEDDGIKLSPEAEKNFEIQKVKVVNSTSFAVPKDAVVTAGLEVNLYRYRDGFYRRIDFDQLSRSLTHITVRSKDIKNGDEIAITGLGFLRIAEIAAFGGAPEGHSH